MSNVYVSDSSNSEKFNLNASQIWASCHVPNIIELTVENKCALVRIIDNRLVFRFSNNLGAFVEVDEMSVEPIYYFDESDNYTTLEGYKSHLKNKEINEFLALISSISVKNRCYLAEINFKKQSLIYTLPNSYSVIMNNNGYEWCVSACVINPDGSINTNTGIKKWCIFTDKNGAYKFLNEIEELPAVTVRKITTYIIEEEV